MAFNSQAIIASIGSDKPLDFNLDMNFVLVPPGQPRVPVKISLYPGESDPGPFPVPDIMPIENRPLQRNEDTGALPPPGSRLDDIQRHGAGDRHGIVVDPINGMLYEFYQARKTSSGWEAAQASVFDLKSNRMLSGSTPRLISTGKAVGSWLEANDSRQKLGNC